MGPISVVSEWDALSSVLFLGCFNTRGNSSEVIKEVFLPDGFCGDYIAVVRSST